MNNFLSLSYSQCSGISGNHWMPVGLYFSYRFIHSPPFQQELVKASFLWLSEGISGGDASANQDTALV